MPVCDRIMIIVFNNRQTWPLECTLSWISANRHLVMDGDFSNVSNHTVTNTAFFPFKTGHLLKEQLTFSFSTYQSFNLWSACYPNEIRLEKSNFGGHQYYCLKLFLASRLYLCDIILSDSKLVGRRNTCNWFYIFHKASSSLRATAP